MLENKPRADFTVGWRELKLLNNYSINQIFFLDSDSRMSPLPCDIKSISLAFTVWTVEPSQFRSKYASEPCNIVFARIGASHSFIPGLDGVDTISIKIIAHPPL